MSARRRDGMGDVRVPICAPRPGVPSSLSKFSGDRRDPETIRRQGWQEMGLLAVNVNDGRLRPEDKAEVERLGELLYGRRL